MRWRLLAAGSASLSAAFMLLEMGHPNAALAAAVAGALALGAGLTLPHVARPRASTW